ncbi:anthranilate synthase component I family protein [Caulobacter segnis]|uniref:anthranilate synthase component I family protein n=1 Tax=Caulobacter segnis TaxID=88688 RepID=UPI00240EF1C8|nr:anthranilate synthase component I family protein [Caulobacter segnis]MDG2520235.1 anthranilate synthase component I family protein [Caulobacter segnis]
MQAISILAFPWREPAAVLCAFAEEPFAMGLLSGGGGAHGRWSYVLRQPDRTAVLHAGDEGDAAAILRNLLGEALPHDPSGPPFQGGVAGLAAYELGARFEPVDLPRDRHWPDLSVGRYPAFLAFDHAAKRVLAVGRGENAARAEACAQQAGDWLNGVEHAPVTGALAEDFTPLQAPQAYEHAVAEVVGRIVEGELFQANIARGWSGRLAARVRPFDVIRRLSSDSPAPFAAYLRLPGAAVVSNSPERFLASSAGGYRVETRPIKGTRPRGRTPDEDEALIEDLRGSAKDRAENLMIVDLMRNDLARVCAPGAVAAPELFRIESFANVHHLVSTVTGRLAQGLTAIDLLRAAFPPGSITGAPKVQAMRVISGLEAPRGPYCGSMFWAGFDGALDSSVLIRTLAFVEDDAGWRFEARAGAGIVADSDPAAERQETEDKISALRRALTETSA